MSKVKTSEIPHYELLCLVSNEFSEDEVKPIQEKVNKIITERKGKITKNEDWGKKRLAYPIKHFGYGYYNLVEFDMDGEEVSKVNKDLRMMSELLRHQIVTKKVKTVEEIAKEKEIKEKIAVKAAKAEEKEEEKETAKEEAKKGDKIELEDLDDKLDKILETDDLV